MTRPKEERRGRPRAKGAADLLVGVDSQTPGACINNISLSGISFTVDTPIEFMTRLMMTLVFPDQDSSQGKAVPFRVVVCEGAVVRCEPVSENDEERYEVAAFFIHLDEVTKDAIEIYIQTH